MQSVRTEKVGVECALHQHSDSRQPDCIADMNWYINIDTFNSYWHSFHLVIAALVAVDCRHRQVWIKNLRCTQNNVLRMNTKQVE